MLLTTTRYLAECPDAHHQDVLRLLPQLLAVQPSAPIPPHGPPPPQGALFLAPLLLQRGEEEEVRRVVASSGACVQSLRRALEQRTGLQGDAQQEVEMLQAVLQTLQL